MPVAVKVSVLRVIQFGDAEEPVINTFPLRRRVAVWFFGAPQSYSQ
jgi:hypothetical protein